MNSNSENGSNKPNRQGRFGWLGGTNGALLRWTGVAALLGSAVFMGSAAMSAPHANAIIRFCSATVCIGSGNGCSTPTTTGVVIEADDGDSFIATDGTKWTCNHGKWVKTPPSKIVSTSTGVTGITATSGNLQVATADPTPSPVKVSTADTGTLRLAR